MKIIRNLVCAAALLSCGSAAAETWPDRAVRIIVPFAPAGPTDVMARLLAAKMSDDLGKQFYIENQAGAGGNTGMGNAARAGADGYTILITSSSYAVNPSLYEKSAYDPDKDFIPITNAAVSPNVLVVNPSLPVTTVKELVDLIKAHPNTYSFASPGAGTTPHLSGELFKLTLGLDLVHVPFGGAGPAIQSAAAGHTPIAFTALPPATPLVKDGKLRALAVTAKTRSPALPDVPTMAEAGFPGQESDTFQGVFVPTGTPPEIAKLIYSEILKVVAMPDVKEKLALLGYEIVANSPEEFAAQIKSEIAKWHKVIVDAGIKAQ